MSTVSFSTVLEGEVARFSTLAHEWWTPDGPFAALHALSPVREAYINRQIVAAFKGRAPESVRILDIGCGGGLMAEALADAGFVVTGLDASLEGIEAARMHAAASGLVIDYRVGTAEALARAGEPPFDVVLALEVLEHVSSVKTLTTAMAALLKPKGLVIAATLNRTVRSFLLGVVAAEALLKWVPAGTHDWDAFVKPSELVALWQAVGIKPVDITGVVFNPLSRSFEERKGKVAVNYLMTGQRKR